MDRIVKDDPSYVRDSNSKAIVSRDNNALKAYKKKKAKQRSEREEFENMKDELSEIKSLLKQLLEKE